MYFHVYHAPMILAQTFRKKFFHFNLLIQFFNLFIHIYLFLYYEGILAFIFEHIMVEEVLCNK